MDELMKKFNVCLQLFNEYRKFQQIPLIVKIFLYFFRINITSMKDCVQSVLCHGVLSHFYVFSKYSSVCLLKIYFKKYLLLRLV